MSWTTLGAPTTTTWANVVEGNHPPPWAQVTSIATTFGGGVNFNCRIRAQYPLIICSDRPWAMRNDLNTGAP